jgi:hypothetical protein
MGNSMVSCRFSQQNQFIETWEKTPGFSRKSSEVVSRTVSEDITSEELNAAQKAGGVPWVQWENRWEDHSMVNNSYKWL